MSTTRPAGFYWARLAYGEPYPCDERTWVVVEVARITGDDFDAYRTGDEAPVTVKEWGPKIEPPTRSEAP